MKYIIILFISIFVANANAASDDRCGLLGFCASQFQRLHSPPSQPFSNQMQEARRSFKPLVPQDNRVPSDPRQILGFEWVGTNLNDLWPQLGVHYVLQPPTERKDKAPLLPPFSTGKQ